MQNYDYIERLTRYLNTYKTLSAKEKTLSSDSIKKGVLSRYDKNTENLYSEIETAIEEEIKKEKANKKEIAQNKEQLRNLIQDEIMENISDEKGTFSAGLIGNITFEKQKRYSFEVNQQEKTELINELISKGLFELLDINEEKLIEFSKEIKNANGHHIYGVEESVDCKLTIR